MKIKFLVYLFSLFLAILNINYLNAQEKTIFVWGGDINLKFTQYIVNLTQKKILDFVICQQQAETMRIY